MKAIYPYARNFSRELEWSIKSLDLIEHDEVFIIGDRPGYEVNAKVIEPIYPFWAELSPYSNTFFKVLHAARLIESEEFIVMNDDFFILKEQEIKAYTIGGLEEHTARRKSNDAYRKALHATMAWLGARGYSTKSYESHSPMVFDAAKFLEMFEETARDLLGGQPLLYRSIYGNMFNVEAEHLEQDFKNPVDYKGMPLLSTSEESFLSPVGKYIRNTIQGIAHDSPEYTVSVVIPAYNAAETIEKCLASIPKHEYITEIIVIDDCSTDKTAEIIKNYPDQRIKAYGHDENRGVGYTFNELVEIASGEYILRIDSDDTFRPEITGVLDRIDGSDIIYYNMVDNDGTVRPLNFNTRMLTVACCHIFRRDFIKDLKTIETNWGEDRHLMQQAVQKHPKELYTGIDAYNYNFPRIGSLTDIKKKQHSGETRNKSLMLAIMSNCTNDVLERPTIFDTINSFRDTFGDDSIDGLAIYIDPNPNPHLIDDYVKMIKKELGDVVPVITTSLSDGYKQALDNTHSDYIFFLEHDWVFQNIEHNLNQIINTMEDDKLWFMLFNQHRNIDDLRLSQWQSYLRGKTLMYCETDRISNNPHIIERETYKKKAMPLVDWTVKGAGLIEQVLEKKFNVSIYGCYDLPPTIVHIDGRRNGLK